MCLNLNTSLVSVEWLKNNLENKHLIILDCTISKVITKNESLEEIVQIKNAIFFDIKNTFSNTKALFPNTVLSEKEFQHKAQNLGINSDSCIVVYDDLGIYSSPRVCWLFQLMGFNNIAVLDGGLPLWKSKKYPMELKNKNQLQKGDFKVDYQPQKIKYTKDVLLATNNNTILIADARSKGRFYGTEPEPRNEVKSGHIPSSISMPFEELQENGRMKSPQELTNIFQKITKNKDEIFFSCGTGITASILALGAHLAEIKNVAVYDGSWIEWGSTENLPIEI